MRAILILLGLTLFQNSALAKDAATTNEVVVNNNITEKEIREAQQAWGQALIEISAVYKKSGIKKAKETAGKILDQAYGYGEGPVLFKPTLASGSTTYRTTKEGALSYFVGGDSKYPQDTGFAIKGWTKYDFKNAAVYIYGDMALTMGDVFLSDINGKMTTVNKTWGFKKNSQGQLKIVLHHSSLPYVPEPKM